MITNQNGSPRPPTVPASAAAIASLVVPGTGQLLARQPRRGLLLLGSAFSLVALLAWRVNLIAPRLAGWVAKFERALSRQPFFIGMMVMGIVIVWLWNAWDAYRLTTTAKRGNPAIFVLIMALFFALGWQISEINLYKAATELADTWPLLSRVLWPWPAALTRQTDVLSASATIEVPCTDTPPLPPAEIPGEPYLVAEPTCGQLSDLDEDNNIIPGTELALQGRGFAPNTETGIWWSDPIGNEFQMRQEGEYVSVMTDDEGSFTIDVIMPYRLMPPSARGTQAHQIEARQVSEVGPLIPSEPLLLSVERMVETIFLGMMATAFGIVLAVPVSFLAARNLMAGSWATMALYYITRTILNIIRSIEPLIWVIIAAQWVGLGPFAGIIALTIHTVAALGKLYSEAIEGIDPGPIEAIQATGATRLQTIAFGVIPQMIPPFVSFSIYRWDINVRMSTVIGLVGGGGIGFILIQYIRLLNFRAAGIAVWFIAITVAILDYVSSEIRERYV
ncbi:MAG: phosphonate ABC transporter, permease protein PhnE [Anaerolineae bacterium]|nr:phosphonate ABC transporter, permease protein PhnE [Anaerolineae bacterium]